MLEFESYFETINNVEQLNKLVEIFNFIEENFPELDRRFAWNQPMYTHHGTFIIGFSVAKNHISVAPEGYTLDLFSDKIVGEGYSHSKKLWKIDNDQEIPFELISELIAFNIMDKKDSNNFWRK